MKISNYLREVQHAVSVVIGEVHREQNQVAALRGELAALTAATDDGYQRSNFLAMNPELDDDFLGTAIHWDTYFGVDKERFHKNVELDDGLSNIAAHEFSVASLSGSLLQYGKQGLSLRFGKQRAGCPDGRMIGSQTLNEVIWQARNQALHWEDGTFSAAVVQCFDALALNINAVFGQYRTRSMAFEVVDLLGWRTVEDFTNDLMLFDV